LKILHTSDWHLGKTLEGYSRIDEQKMFINELEKICNDEKVDLIIVAGDIYDTVNPPAEAEKLFYYAVKALSLDGERPIIVIAGNHDSSNRLTASKPISSEFGIILLGTPKSIADTGDYGKFKINNSGEGFLELEKNNQKIVFLTMPYPTEKSLNEIISDSLDEKEMQISYSKKIAEILKEKSINFRDNTINIIIGHFFINGSIEDGTEENIQLGGSYAVSSNVFPENTQYVAMGHLHRPQKVKNCNIEYAYYSGSPIQYSKSEIQYSKSVFVFDIDESNIYNFKKISLSNYKPIEIWRCDSYEDALNKCNSNCEKKCWVYLQIKSDYPLMPIQIRNLKTSKKDIINIDIILNGCEKQEIEQEYKEKTIGEYFCDFYKKCNDILPSDEVYDLFMKFANMGSDNDETFDA